MKKSNRRNEVVTIGLDIGDKYSYFYALDEEREVVEEGRVETERGELEEWAKDFPPVCVAMETGTHSPWVSVLMRSCGHEVLVGNARKLHLISKNEQKTDRRDAELLARLAYSDPKLLSPIRHRGPRAQRDLSILRARDAAVGARTDLVNHVRGSVKSSGYRLPKCSTHSFHEKVKDAIPEGLREALNPLLAFIETLSAEIKQFDALIETRCEIKYPETKRLAQVGGVGFLTALAYILILEDPKRFKKSRAVGAFVGLTPRKDQSGDQKPQLRITKTGDVFLRRLLVGSAHYILGPFGPD